MAPLLLVQHRAEHRPIPTPTVQVTPLTTLYYKPIVQPLAQAMYQLTVRQQLQKFTAHILLR